MASLLCHIHFWTMQPLSPTITSGTHIGIHSYQPKGTAFKTDTEVCRRYWAEGRGIVWHLPNHRPDKLRDALRECEELLSSQRVLCLQWKTLRHFVIVLETGTLLVFTVAKHSGDVENILIDRSILPRIQGHLDRALLLDGSLILLHSQHAAVTVVSIPQGRRASLSVTTPLTLSHDKLKKKIDKLSTIDFKITTLDVKGLPDSRIDRHIVVNAQRDLIVIWWCDIQDNGLQWSALADGEHTNMILIRLKSNSKLEVLTKLQTRNDPLEVFFSKLHSNTLYVFGHTTENPSSVEESSNVYELSLIDCSDKKSIKQTLEASMHCDSQVSVCSTNKDETLLLVGCDNGDLVIFDIKRDRSKKSKAFFSPISHISWHPAGGVVFVCGSRGEVQCLDMALNSVQFLIANEEISSTPLLELGSLYMVPVQLEHTGWASISREGEGHSGCYDNFVMVFNQGPIVMLRFELGLHSKGRLSAFEMLCEYLQHNQLYQGLELVLAMNWELYPQDCFHALTVFMDHLLCLPLTPTNEDLMESVLGGFFAGEFSLHIQMEYKKPVHLLSKRFFFKLLRNLRFEKAFRLAVELSSKELFMELHYTALEKKELSLAELAMKKAELLKEDEVDHEDQVISTTDLQLDIIDESHYSHVNVKPSFSSLENETQGVNIKLQKSDEVKSKNQGGVVKPNEEVTSSRSKDKPPTVTPWTPYNKVNVVNFGYFS